MGFLPELCNLMKGLKVCMTSTFARVRPCIARAETPAASAARYSTARMGLYSIFDSERESHDVLNLVDTEQILSGVPEPHGTSLKFLTIY